MQSLHEDFTSEISDLNLKYEHLCKTKSLMKLALEKSQKNHSIKNKRNKHLDVKVINQKDLDAIVQASFLNLLEEYMHNH